MKRAAAGLGLIAFLMVLAGGSLTAQVGERPRDSDYTEDAEDAIDDAEDAKDDAERRAHYQMALTAAQAEITANPNNPLGHRLAALAALGLGQYEDAGAHFDRAAELYPLYEFENEPIRQAAWIDLYNEASPLVSSGDYAGAAVIFENAHAIFKGRPEVMVTLAQIYGSMGEYDRAIEFVGAVDTFMASETASVADSATVAGWEDAASVLPTLRAQALAAAGRPAEAVEAYRALTVAEPNNLEYIRGLAQVLMDSGREDEALEVYVDLMAQPGLSGQDLFAIGVGFYQANDYVNAVNAFSAAADKNPTDRDSIEMWARSMMLDEKFEGLAEVAQQWVALDPYSQNGYLIWAQAANKTEDAEGTQQAMNAAQELVVSVDQLQLQRFGSGGAVVSGSLVNKTLTAGSPVTLRVNFFGPSGAPIGTVTSSVTVGETDMAEIFEVQFDSAEAVGGYSYELTIG